MLFCYLLILARGAIDNFGTKLAPANRKKHFADIQLVSFVTYCSLKWEGLSDHLGRTITAISSSNDVIMTSLVM